jgi:hypothetical protein
MGIVYRAFDNFSIHLILGKIWGIIIGSTTIREAA